MVVHLGVVLIAVAFAASHAYEHQAQFTLTVGKPATFRGPDARVPGGQDGQRARA